LQQQAVLMPPAGVQQEEKAQMGALLQLPGRAMALLLVMLLLPLWRPATRSRSLHGPRYIIHSSSSSSRRLQSMNSSSSSPALLG